MSTRNDSETGRGNGGGLFRLSITPPGRSRSPWDGPVRLGDDDDGSARKKTSACIPYWLNDRYHANRIRELHGGDISYCRKLGEFLIWHGTHWGPDEDFTMWQWAVDAAHDIWLEAAEMPEEAAARRSYMQRWAMQAERRRHIENALANLRALSDVAVAPDAFDRDPWLFNVQNGTIDLRTGELRPHRREDMITRVSRVAYEPGTEPGRWLQFLSEVFDGNTRLIDFVRRACGYTLCGSVDERKLFFLHGGGANGKTTFLETLAHVMGDYALRLVPGALFSSSGQALPAAVGELRARRLALTGEIEFGACLSGARVKELTGPGPLTGRLARRDGFTFEPTHTLFLRGSHLPAVRGADRAIWRRMRVIPFAVTIPEEKHERDLPAQLRAEASGILNWLVEGCLEWQKHGLGEPGDVTAATLEYRSDMDVLGNFINECCVVSRDGQETSAALYLAYKNWCYTNNERAMSTRTLGIRLKERGFVSRQIGKTRDRTWQGLALKKED